MISYVYENVPLEIHCICIFVPLEFCILEGNYSNLLLFEFNVSIIILKIIYIECSCLSM